MEKKKKKVLVGWATKNCFRYTFFNQKTGMQHIATLSAKKLCYDDVKVRITIEEL